MLGIPDQRLEERWSMSATCEEEKKATTDVDVGGSCRPGGDDDRTVDDVGKLCSRGYRGVARRFKDDTYPSHSCLPEADNER